MEPPAQPQRGFVNVFVVRRITDGTLHLITQFRFREHARTTKDRKSTRLNSSHLVISYAVFCLKKKTFIFRAATPRIRVCHTVSDTVTDLDLVQIQILMSSHRPLSPHGLNTRWTPPRPAHAIQS